MHVTGDFRDGWIRAPEGLRGTVVITSCNRIPGLRYVTPDSDGSGPNRTRVVSDKDAGGSGARAPESWPADLGIALSLHLWNRRGLGGDSADLGIALRCASNEPNQTEAPAFSAPAPCESCERNQNIRGGRNQNMHPGQACKRARHARGPETCRAGQEGQAGAR